MLQYKKQLLSYLFLLLGVGNFSAFAQCWTMISTDDAGYHNLGLQSNGTLWAWGPNNNGRLGNGTTLNQLTPVQIGTDTDWVWVSAGSASSYALKQDGSLWAWGKNSIGQLALGDSTDRLVPTPVNPNATWMKLSAGNGYVIAQRTDGTLWSNAWGTVQPSNPAQVFLTSVASYTDWTSFDAGYSQVVALRSNHSVWGFGLGTNGCLATGSDGGYQTATQLFPSTDWNQTVTGNGSSFFKKQNGTIWGVGSNMVGQLGLGFVSLSPTSVYAVTQIGTATDWQSLESAGNGVLMALKTNGTLWACGANNQGQLGLGDTQNRSLLTQVGTANHWAKVRCGAYHIIALDQTGSLWSWGQNQFGQLGLGDTTSRLTPTLVGTPCTMGTPQQKKTLFQLIENPVHDWARLLFSQDGSKTITVTTLQGQVLQTFTTTDELVVVNMSSYPSGMYLLTSQLEGMQHTVKVVRE